ncbi:MAG TPA: TRAP transporter substrate-binding protein [Xanthobacteraceae bacterium]|jgi:TRAP-type C4-dicarboxylate transport system substrate-binding protein
MLIGRVGKVCILSGALVLGAAVAQAQTVELKLSHFVPPQHAFHKWAVEWAKRLEDGSNGRLKITIYPNGQLVGPPNRQFDAARNGITDIAFTLHGVTPGRYPMTELANLPFTWPSEGALCSVMGKRMTELAPKYLAQEHTGLHILFMAMANPIVVYSKVPIRTVDDFKGLKIRYASITNKNLLDAVGATTLLIPPPESQDALAKGIAQAATFPHEAGLAYDLASVVKYAIEPPLASATFALVMNPAKYDSLPPDLRALIDKESGAAGAVSFGKAWEAQEKFARDLEVSKKGLEIITLPDNEVAKLKQIGKAQTQEAVAALEKQGKPARQFLEEYTK